MLVIYALPDGALMINGKEQTLETLREYAAEFAPEGECVLRIDRGNLVKGILPVIEILRAAGLRVFSCMKPVDPALGIETIFPLPAPDSEEPALEVRLTRAEAGLLPDRNDVEGRAVRALLLDDARIEETLHALIRLKMAGATGFAFD